MQLYSLWNVMRYTVGYNGVGACIPTGKFTRSVFKDLGISLELWGTDDFPHTFLHGEVPEGNTFEVPGGELLAAIRKNQGSPYCSNVPQLEDRMYVGHVLGEPGEPAVFDLTADQWHLMHGKKIPGISGRGYHGPARLAPERLHKLYTNASNWHPDS